MCVFDGCKYLNIAKAGGKGNYGPVFQNSIELITLDSESDLPALQDLAMGYDIFGFSNMVLYATLFKEYVLALREMLWVVEDKHYIVFNLSMGIHTCECQAL